MPNIVAIGTGMAGFGAACEPEGTRMESAAMCDSNPCGAAPSFHPDTGFTLANGTQMSFAKAIEPGDQCWPERESCVPATPGVHATQGRIGLFSHCGTGNLGDEATVATVLQSIKHRWPAASVVGLSMDPEDSARRHGIPCFPMRQSIFPFEREWSSMSLPADANGYTEKLKEAFKKSGPVFRVAKAIRRVVIVRPAQFIREVTFLGRSMFLVGQLDLIIICGGGQLLDWGGPWAFPYTLFKWILLAKCSGVKCMFLNSGAGPLDSPLSRWFAKRALNMADYVSLRDHMSGKLLRQIGFRGKMKVVADSVWGLQLPDGLEGKPIAPQAELVIGIAPMAYGDSSRHWVDDNDGYQRLIGNLTEFCSRMLERGHRIKLFSSDIWFDSQAIADLDAAIRTRFPALAQERLVQESVANISDLLAALSHLDCYVTCRFHGVVFASLLNVPTIALSPHPKVTTLMEDLGLPEYCMDITRCDAGDLTSRVDHLIANMDDIKERIGRHVAQLQSRVTSQFDALFVANAETHTEGEDVLSVRSVR